MTARRRRPAAVRSAARAVFEPVERRRLLAADAFDVPGGIAPDAFEPNDTLATATDLGTDPFGTLAGLTIGQFDSGDVFRVVPVASGPMTFRADFSHDEGDVDLQLTDASGDILAVSAGSDDSETVTFNNGVAGQAYFVHAYVSNGGTSFGYTLAYSTFVAPDAYEENDTQTAPANISNAVDFAADNLTIDQIGDEDWYQFTASRTGTVSVAARFDHELGDVDLYAYSQIGSPALSGSTSQDDDEAFEFQVTAGAQYRVLAVGVDGPSPDYDLRISTPVAPDAYEANESFAAATNFNTDPGRQLDGLTVHTPSDNDYYRIVANASGTIDVGISFEHDDADLQLFFYEGGVGLVDWSTGSTDAESVGWDGVAGQEYFVRVFAEGGATSAGYALTYRTPVALDAYEANESFAAATDFDRDPDRQLAGLTLHSPGDNDYYRVVANDAGTLTASIAFEHDDANLTLFLYQGGIGLVDSSTGTTDAESIAHPANAGQEYFLRVYAEGGATIGNYTLSYSTPVDPDALEPNNPPSFANLGVAPNTLRTGLTLHDEPDIDYFRFTQTVAGPLNVRLDFEHDFGNLDLDVFRATPFGMLDPVASSASLDDDEEAFVANAPVGTYFVKVAGDRSPDYSLLVSAASAAQAPIVTSAAERFETFAGVQFNLSEPTTGAAANDFVVTNTTTGATLPTSAYAVVSGNGGREQTVRLNGVPANGRYRVTLVGSGIADADGNAVDGDLNAAAGGDYAAEFRFLAGDANRDGAVGFADLSTLAVNYGQGGRTFSQGNFDYSADGLVSFADLALLAGQYGQGVPVPQQLRALPGATRPSFFADAGRIGLFDARDDRRITGIVR